MALGPHIIRFGQRLLGDGIVARTLARWRVADALRWRRDRRILQQGWYDTSLLGQSARFIVTSRTQLAHIDATWREEAMLRRMIDYVHDNDVVYDVGANIGIVTLALLLHRGERTITVHAFEPEPNNAAALRGNLAANRCEATVHAAALGDHTGEAELFVDPHIGGGSHSLVRRGSAVVRVPITTADHLAETAGVPQCVKIDVEGAELAVLRGMSHLLSQRLVRDLFIEVHPTLMLKEEGGPTALTDWLRRHGYERVWQHRRGDEWHEHYRPTA